MPHQGMRRRASWFTTEQVTREGRVRRRVEEYLVSPSRADPSPDDEPLRPPYY